MDFDARPSIIPDSVGVCECCPESSIDNGEYYTGSLRCKLMNNDIVWMKIGEDKYIAQAHVYYAGLCINLGVEERCQKQ